MRTEAEIREAIDVQAAACMDGIDPIMIQTRDATIEALRYALGIDDADSSPMRHSLAMVIEDMREDQQRGMSA